MLHKLYLRPKLSAKSGVTVCILTPNHPLTVLPYCINWFITPSAKDDGIAKPIPTLPPEGEYIAVFTPITSPSKLNNGPPEFPLLIGASVCIKSSKDLHLYL